MKRFIVILIALLLMIVPTTSLAVDQTAVDEYQKMLESRHDPNNRLDGSTKDAMWKAFWEHIAVKEPVTLKPEMIDETGKPKYKFPVSVIAGGNVMGYKDGNVRTAKINPIWSMCVDQNDNIYFIDTTANSIRKYNPTDKTIKTYKQCDEDFDLNIKVDGRNTVVDSSEALLAKLVWNPFNNGIYVAADYPGYFNIIYQIKPDAYIETYDNKHPVTSIYYNDFIKFTPTGEIWFSNRDSRYQPHTRIMLGNHLDLADVMTEASYFTDKDGTSTGPRFWENVDAIMTDDNTMYIYDSYSRTLLKYTIFPNTWDVIARYNEYFDTVTSYGNKFYVTEGDGIYQISLDGELRKIADNTNLKYTC